MKHPFSNKGTPIIWTVTSVLVVIVGIWYLVRQNVAAAYSVPTMAMEKTILRGGKVLVDKLNYRPIKRGDILVFHFPVGDTVIDLPDYQAMRPYYDVIRELGRGNADSGRQILLASPTDYPLSIRPVDQRETYLKRCIGIPGDTLGMREGELYINGHLLAWPAESETNFRVITNGQPLDQEAIKARYGFDINNSEEVQATGNANEFEIILTWKSREKMLKDGFAKSITPDIDSSTAGVFPNDEAHQWTRDSYGPLWIPAKGASIQLTALNYPIYERIIRTYEGNKLDKRNGKIYINDREQTSYTFKMNYYWVIGDNLHGSQDSRYWGFVPEDHLIGKVSAIL